MSTAQSRLESMLATVLHSANNKDIKKYLEELAEEYGEPEATVADVRQITDSVLAGRTLSGEVYKMREERY